MTRRLFFVLLAMLVAASFLSAVIYFYTGRLPFPARLIPESQRIIVESSYPGYRLSFLNRRALVDFLDERGFFENEVEFPGIDDKGRPVGSKVERLVIELTDQEQDRLGIVDSDTSVLTGSVGFYLEEEGVARIKVYIDPGLISIKETNESGTSASWRVNAFVLRGIYSISNSESLPKEERFKKVEELVNSFGDDNYPLVVLNE